MNRYSGKPLLRLIECYVLDVVGQLDNQQRATLEAMEPKLQSLYKSGGTWRQIVAEQMNFDESLNDANPRLLENVLERCACSGHACRRKPICDVVRKSELRY